MTNASENLEYMRQMHASEVREIVSEKLTDVPFTPRQILLLLLFYGTGELPAFMRKGGQPDNEVLDIDTLVGKLEADPYLVNDVKRYFKNYGDQAYFRAQDALNK